MIVVMWRLDEFIVQAPFFCVRIGGKSVSLQIGMKKFLAKIYSASVRRLRRVWIDCFWTHPDNLWALKVTMAIALMVIPCCLLGDPFVGCTLALGAVGAALAENDDHPLGRMRSLVVTIISFVIVSMSVELLKDYPWIFGMGLAATSFTLILLGGLSTRYQGVTFGALLVSVYAMLGAGIKPWYYQPILLPLGGLMYGSISLLLLSLRPYRLLKEQLAVAYGHLADYLSVKAELFPCTKDEYKEGRTQMAERNIAVGRGIDSCKDVIYSCLDVLGGKSTEGLSPLYHQWILLQQLHERAASTHQRYDVLSRRCRHPLLLEGLGQYLYCLSEAIRHYADTIITGENFVLPADLRWTKEVVGHQLEESTDDPEYAALSMLYSNLSRISLLLEHANDSQHAEPVPVETLQYRPAPLKQRLRTLLDENHPRFRHAVRLSLCLVAGYALVEAFHMNKGAWVVLTILFVCQQSYVATRQRLFERIFGTFVGVALGVIWAHLLPTVAGQIVLLLFSIFTFFYWVRRRYTYAVVFITMFVIAAFNLQTGTGVAVMTYRLLDTLLGAVMAFLAVRYIWPDWQYRHLPQLMTDAITKTLRYFNTIYENDVRGAAYYHNRRTAHQADNALAKAWKGMHAEPRKKRKLQRKAYALTYMHHSLLSYVSALGAHYYSKPLTTEDVEICRYISRVIEQVQHNFSPTPVETGHPVTIEEVTAWNAAFVKRLTTTDNHNMVILYNISKVAAELLKESISKSRRR
uniref:YccS family putative transporter n=1 Tax=Prevotella sp. GTC17260 TaxID=3236796 RepID=A0AB33JCN4_9BACT